MKIKNALPKLLVVLSAIVLMASCEEDLGTIGSEVIGDQDVNATLDASRTIRSYSKKLEAVQSNGLQINQLGLYNDLVYGMSKVNLLAQVTLEDVNPTINYLSVVDSVVLYIPYFSEQTTDDEDLTTYVLDSIYGNTPMDISIFESNYFLREFDPNTGFENNQNYYSNQNDLFESFKGELIYAVTDFLPSNESYTETITEPDDAGDNTSSNTVVAPGIRFQLPKQFFEDKILSMEGTPELLNNNNFREYFRGLFFEVNGTDTNLIKFDMSDARLDIYFTSQFEKPDITVISEITEPIAREEKKITLRFDAINVNVFENQLNPQIESELISPDQVNGAEKLYVRGGEGIVTVVELFGEDNDGNGVADELDEIRQNKWLINEANLIFYVDKDVVPGGSQEPERLILYDIENGRLLTDYTLDTTSGETDQVDSYTTHLGRLVRDSDGRGDYYKLRITNHLSSLIHQDSTNVKLGVIVSQNVAVPNFQEVVNTKSSNRDFSEQVPSSSVMSDEGTVLHGNTAADETKRLKLQIYYTKSD
tara:strand:- start:4666 stop:6270 length:1605 start_codon:yes stop_codon:yes gene_type:complete